MIKFTVTFATSNTSDNDAFDDKMITLFINMICKFCDLIVGLIINFALSYCLEAITMENCVNLDSYRIIAISIQIKED